MAIFKSDADKILDQLLEKMHLHIQGTSSLLGRSENPAESLKVAQLELEHLQALHELLIEKVKAKKTQVDQLQIRVSPFLSFNEQVVAHFVTFLTEESLLAFEQVVPQLAQSPAITSQWEDLDQQRQFQSNSVDLTPRERGIRFVLASQYALKMETSARYHYNPRDHITKQYEWPERLYTRDDFKHDFQAYDNGDEPPPNLEFFLRLSYREDESDEAPTKVLLEGFFSDYSDLDPWDHEHYTIIELGQDNTHLHTVCNNLRLWDDPERMGVSIYSTWMRNNIIEWPLLEMKAYMKRIALTVLACEPHQKTDHKLQLFQSHLVVATRGFHSNKDLLAIMPPRPYLAKARTANLLNCVNVAIKPTEEMKGNIGFRIMIDWGTQDVYTRRKSILDHF